MNKFNLNITFPNQKLPESSKNEEWRKQNVDAAETLISVTSGKDRMGAIDSTVIKHVTSDEC